MQNFENTEVEFILVLPELTFFLKKLHFTCDRMIMLRVTSEEFTRWKRAGVGWESTEVDFMAKATNSWSSHKMEIAEIKSFASINGTGAFDFENLKVENYFSSASLTFCWDILSERTPPFFRASHHFNFCSRWRKPKMFSKTFQVWLSVGTSIKHSVSDASLRYFKITMNAEMSWGFWVAPLKKCWIG